MVCGGKKSIGYECDRDYKPFRKEGTMEKVDLLRSNMQF